MANETDSISNQTPDAPQEQPDAGPSQQQIWAQSTPALEAQWHTNCEDGLTTQEAKTRFAQQGPNELQAKKPSNLLRFLKQFNSSIIYILAAAAIITFLLHRYSDSIVIGLVIIANALIGYFQEISADNALDKIKELLVSENYVIRDGQKLELPSRELVTGDLVQLEAGDSVPADMRLISADNLNIQESVLTGETNSVEKTEEPITADNLPLAERSNMAFASTAVTSGSGLGIVVATATHTEIGKIQQDVAEVKAKPTPLMQNLNRLGLGLSIAIVIAAVLLFILGMITHVYSLPTLLIAVITMVVGSMPEGLPASTSVVLAMGTRRLTKQHAIVKTLPAVETLGAVDIVNTDKTGTLTKNEMTVTDILTNHHAYTVSGVGYDAEGQVLNDDVQPVDWQDNHDLNWLVNIAGQTSDAAFHEENGQWILAGEPTDGALTALYHKLTGNEPEINEIESLPFDSAFRYSARLVDMDQDRVLLVKGAPQTLIHLVQAHGGDTSLDQWQSRLDTLTHQGKRVVALAYQPVASDETEIEPDQIGDGLVIVGMVGIIDPPRPEVAKAVQQLRFAGIQVKMITGDDPDTAAAIASQLHLAEVPKAITGPEINEMSDEELTDKIDTYTVFARTTPADKLRIVRAQQARGHVVSMTGDGVNDAPALKQADIGVAMGIKGTDVAKGSADMVLADDNFTTILTAVREGRHVFDNIRKTIRFLLPTSFAEGLIVVMSILLDQSLPLFPTQLLWINMVSALTIQFAFIFEPAENDIMARGPRDVKAGIMSKLDVVEVIYVSLLISGLGMLAYDTLVNHSITAAVGSTMTLNVVIFGKIFYLFNLRNNHPVISKYFFQNKMAFYIIGLLIVLQLGIIYLPFMQGIFHTTSVNFWYGWGIPIIAGIVVLVVTEIVKLFRLRWDDMHQSRMEK
ncbi:HAD-IC family P-type ATPase [Secundilactobacillus paracollinoides]|uniref:Magnesium-transporting ATPase n=1 Tax=Secundilactobacillus paracollinoides TaxID=240427 RepID=A0A1B2IXH3_9LACO|nr:HAD-IC family P-type ATPase [Secundilactobacillus paracollinoides]ANZ60862.1 magnesium-transporting ATPase [Secundilactobacillus paracollinoides]ANZ66720.1 magnesium-transporting ATPase [Secundilactobacillus paracollinoides]